MKSYLQNFKYELAGQEGQPKLVFLHGVMGSGANWRKITSLLQDRFQILTFDQRGHGRSFKPKSGYAPEDYAGNRAGRNHAAARPGCAAG